MYFNYLSPFLPHLMKIVSKHIPITEEQLKKKSIYLRVFIDMSHLFTPGNWTKTNSLWWFILEIENLDTGSEIHLEISERLCSIQLCLTFQLNEVETCATSNLWDFFFIQVFSLEWLWPPSPMDYQWMKPSCLSSSRNWATGDIWWER